MGQQTWCITDLWMRSCVRVWLRLFSPLREKNGWLNRMPSFQNCSRLVLADCPFPSMERTVLAGTCILFFPNRKSTNIMSPDLQGKFSTSSWDNFILLRHRWSAFWYYDWSNPVLFNDTHKFFAFYYSCIQSTYDSTSDLNPSWYMGLKIEVTQMPTPLMPPD